jgi:hypothetical protein
VAAFLLWVLRILVAVEEQMVVLDLWTTEVEVEVEVEAEQGVMRFEKVWNSISVM